MTNLMNLRSRYECKKITSEEYENALIERTGDILEMERGFKILDFLGRGSFGCVLSAKSPDYDSEIAVKITRSERTRDGEINIWPNLENEHILPVFEVVRMQYVNIFITPRLAKDLETALRDDDFRRNASGLKMVKSWFCQTLRAVDYLHRNRLCHFDLKADNVLIDYDSSAKLSDFSFLQKDDTIIRRCGAPLIYRPPTSEIEILSNDGYSFDMWCYGIMVLNFLTQHHMLEGIKSIDKKTFDWYEIVYPVLLNIVDMDNFQSLVSASFPASDLHKQDFEDALNFIHFLLRINPVDRPAATEALEHAFLMKGNLRSENLDSLWVKDLCASDDLVSWSLHSEFKNSLRKNRMKLNRNKFRYNRVSQLKNRKWRKRPKEMTKSMNYDVAIVHSLEQHLEEEDRICKTWINDLELEMVSKTHELEIEKDMFCEAKIYQEFASENEKRGDSLKVTYYTKERHGNDITTKGTTDTPFRVDIEQPILIHDNAHLCMSDENSFQDDVNKNGTYCRREQVSEVDFNTEESREMPTKKGRIRKISEWFRDKLIKFCICGGKPASGKGSKK